MFTNTPDEHFLIGVHPEYAQVSFAAGFSGHGFKFCGVVGEITADLAGQEATCHNIRLFRDVSSVIQVDTFDETGILVGQIKDVPESLWVTHRGLFEKTEEPNKRRIVEHRLARGRSRRMPSG